METSLRAFLENHEQAVQIVANVLLGHRILDEAKQLAKHLLRHGEARAFGLRPGEAGKVLSGQGLEHKAALAGLQLNALVLRLQSDFHPFGQRAKNVEQLACANSARPEI